MLAVAIARRVRAGAVPLETCQSLVAVRCKTARAERSLKPAPPPPKTTSRKSIQPVLFKNPDVVGPMNERGERVPGAYIYGVKPEDVADLTPEGRLALDLTLASQDLLHRYARANIIKQFQKHQDDCGSTEVQIALASYKIEYLREHFQSAKKDVTSMRGFQLLLVKRNKLLKYLRDQDLASYVNLINKLKIAPLPERYSLWKSYRR
eukprot:Opistho-2@53460